MKTWIVLRIFSTWG